MSPSKPHTDPSCFCDRCACWARDHGVQQDRDMLDAAKRAFLLRLIKAMGITSHVDEVVEGMMSLSYDLYLRKCGRDLGVLP